MKPNDFTYVRARSLNEVFDLLDEHNDSAKILAGGQSLLATLNMRLSAPELLIDINDLEELHGIVVADDVVRVGALTRHVELLRSPQIATHVPLLTKAIKHVAHAAIRNRGTIGGSISFADPAAELPACVVALDARLQLCSREGYRTIPAREFFHDLYTTSLRQNELLQCVEFPTASVSSVCAFREFARRSGDFAAVGLALSGNREGAKLGKLALVFFGVANTPVLAQHAAAQLVNRQPDADAIAAAQQSLQADFEAIGDLHTSAPMKMHLAKHFLKEVIEELAV